MLMMRAIVIADIIVYASEMSMTELQPVTLLRNGNPSWVHPESCTKFFVMVMV